MKNLLLAVALLVAVMTKAQSRLKIGPYYTLGVSSYYGGGSGMGMGNSPDYAFKPSMGLGITGQYALNDHLGLILSSGYQQRGATFDKGMYPYDPKYRFNYLDIGAGVYYETKAVIRKSRLRVDLAGTYNRLPRSERINSYEAYNLADDSKKNDFGIVMSLGLVIPRAQHDVFYLSAFSNLGLSNVFGGVLAENGQVGKNMLVGLKLSFLLGFKNKTENE